MRRGGSGDRAVRGAELSKKLGLLERVRHVCQAVQIALPGVVVVGEQSAGKSSLLENISGIQFPRAQNTCTRMPCILTMLTDPSILEPYAKVRQCAVGEVEEKIRALTAQHATGDTFISRKALYVRVVRKDGPQLSLIDLPGVTHNADKMADIHEVTVSLVEEYVRHEEVVILCVIPAMSDFGNAEVIKLARKYDPEGKRTLGVVTKCDDAARAEASDVVDKTLMRRDSDVQLKLGFHCVVNRSQKNIDDNMARKDLWVKEQQLFETSERLRGLPSDHWGTLRLMEKIARIQASRVDECLPKIKEAVRAKLLELREAIVVVVVAVVVVEDQYRLFNGVLRKVSDDLQRRVRAEFMSSDPHDKALTIAPRVAQMVQEFRTRLQEENPEWLGRDMIDQVEDTVETFVHGYTVDNLTGPQVFISLIRRTFVEEGMLKDAADELVENIASHLRTVVTHVVAKHANVHVMLASRLAEKAADVIDHCLEMARELCTALTEAQQVTSTTDGSYRVKLTHFRRSWSEKAADQVQGREVKDTHEEKLTPEFLAMVQKSRDEPQKLAVLEICASLQIYSGFLIQGFVEMAAKLVKFNMVELLATRLEERWREDLAGSRLPELFPKDHEMARRRADLTSKMAALTEFREQLACLRISPPLKKLRPEANNFHTKVQQKGCAEASAVHAGVSDGVQTAVPHGGQAEVPTLTSNGLHSDQAERQGGDEAVRQVSSIPEVQKF
ncbi:unnamed protein product [Polarella glacialis]|uniref:Dynamin-type G domain-containing protein n=1 Tax=Polarella glacialis TaxID=89957 RepID=A0A813DAD5_POLGL|nr:unnamed protein product [Polarella glacialis]